MTPRRAPAERATIDRMEHVRTGVQRRTLIGAGIAVLAFGGVIGAFAATDDDDSGPRQEISDTAETTTTTEAPTTTVEVTTTVAAPLAMSPTTTTTTTAPVEATAPPTIPAPALVVVASVVGLSEANARDSMQELAVTVEGAGSNIVAQSLSAGAQVPPGTSVTLTLGDPYAD